MAGNDNETGGGNKKPMKTVVPTNETMMGAKKAFINRGEKPIRETKNNKQ